MNKLIIIGCGGHARSCLDIIIDTKDYDISGFIIDDEEFKHKNKFLDYPVLGNDSDLEVLYSRFQNAFIGIGQIKDPNPRLNLFTKLKKIGYKLPLITSLSAQISKNSSIEEGSIIMNQVLVNSRAFIGKNCIINNKALIEHDVTVHDNCHISTGAILNGDVTVGQNTFIGSGAVIKNGVSIGDNCIISAGVFLNSDLEDHQTFR